MRKYFSLLLLTFAFFVSEHAANGEERTIRFSGGKESSILRRLNAVKSMSPSYQVDISNHSEIRQTKLSAEFKFRVKGDILLDGGVLQRALIECEIKSAQEDGFPKSCTVEVTKDRTQIRGADGQVINVWPIVGMLLFDCFKAEDAPEIGFREKLNPDDYLACFASGWNLILKVTAADETTYKFESVKDWGNLKPRYPDVLGTDFQRSGFSPIQLGTVVLNSKSLLLESASLKQTDTINPRRFSLFEFKRIP